MNTFVIILCILCVGIGCFVAYARKFANPTTVEYYIGVRGAGKSTLATKEALAWQARGRRVYSNFEIFGCYYIDPKVIGVESLPPDSLLLLDEVSLIWSNRDFKTFPKEVESFFRLCRKRKISVKMYSQSFDVDSKIRSLVDSLYILVKIANVFTIAKKVKRTIVLHSSSQDETGQRQSEGFVSENFSYDLPSTWKFCFIPRWIAFFNSFEAPILPDPKEERKKFIFQNEPYMYRMTHYKTYKIEQVKQIRDAVLRHWEMFKHSFTTTYAQYRQFVLFPIQSEFDPCLITKNYQMTSCRNIS